MKFKYLKIDLESKTTYACHAARPHDVDFAWLNKNSGELFNTDVNVLERGMMLRNERNDSCEQNCWSAEDRNATSPRIYQGGVERTHTTVHTKPEIIDLTIGGDCNLTCSYCCKEFSSAWRRDLIGNGDYPLNDLRYTGGIKDRALLKISQRELKKTAQYQLLLNEIQSAAPTLKTLTVTGGEPFLDNSLLEILSNLGLNKSAVIKIYTGLGVDYTRFVKIVDKLKQLDNVLIIVSAESIDEFLEFNRYGSKWEDFKKKIELLKEQNINFRFHCTLTNLTIFGFKKFFDYFNKERIIVTYAYQPQMMAPYVLDPESKQHIQKDIETLPAEFKDPILKSLATNPTEQERSDISIFLKEFVSRRKDISLNIFPKSFF
jgi:organic radical activating enzyme